MSDATTLELERVIAATPEAVFRAWTSPDAMKRWYQDRPDDVVNIEELDLRVGGSYRIEFGPQGEPPYVESGSYLEINPPHRLVMRETLTTPDGIAWSDTTVTLTLTEQDGKTLLRLKHEKFPSTEARNNAAGGWPGFIDRIATLVTQG